MADDLINHMSKRMFENSQAIANVTVLFATTLISAGIADRDALVSRLRAAADAASTEATRTFGEPARPNPLLIDIADMLERATSALR